MRACRGIHARVIILKFPMKMNDLVASRPTYFIFIGYLKTGHGGGGSSELGPSWHGASFMWADLAWAELVLGRVVRNSSKLDPL